jgi:hypothetical protein
MPDVGTSRPVWSAFRYALPGPAHAALRSAVWRDLHRRHALNVAPSVWSVVHDLDGLGELCDRISAAGGEVSLTPVGTVDRGDVALQSRLDLACEHVWDDLRTSIDWVESQVAAAGVDGEAARRAVDELRAGYRDARPRDVIDSVVGRHVADRLGALEAAVAPEPGDPRARAVHRPHRVRVSGVWDRVDGLVTVVAALQPCPTLVWERALLDFETWAYRPSPQRLPVVHGTVVDVVAPGDVDAVVSALSARVSSFDRTLE